MGEPSSSSYGGSSGSGLIREVVATGAPGPPPEGTEPTSKKRFRPQAEEELEGFEGILARIGRLARMSEKPDIFHTKQWLKSRDGGKTIAAKLGAYSKYRNLLAHPARRQILEFLEALEED